MRLHRTFAVVLAGLLGLAACGGSDDSADDAQEVETTIETPDQTTDGSGDDTDDGSTGLVDGFEPIAVRVRLPGGAVVAADETTIRVTPDPADEPIQEVEWSALFDVASALSSTGIHSESCLEPSAIWVDVGAPDRITFVSGSVCDGTPEADEVLAALAPLGAALGTELLDVPNGRLPEAAPETPAGSTVTFFFSEGSFPDAAFVDLSVIDESATAETDSGNTTISLSTGEFDRLVESLLEADLPEDATDCVGGPTNGVTVTLGDDVALQRNNNPCDDSAGFDALNETIDPILTRMGISL